jgi:hypothetical protein
MTGSTRIAFTVRVAKVDHVCGTNFRAARSAAVCFKRRGGEWG